MTSELPSTLRLLDRKEVAAMLGICTKTLDRKLAKGEFPQPIRVTERRVRWRASAIEKWLDEKGGK